MHQLGQVLTRPPRRVVVVHALICEKRAGATGWDKFRPVVITADDLRSEKLGVEAG